jgi:hypothetical protein
LGVKIVSAHENIPRWLTPPQLAQMLGIDPIKVIGWIKRGELAAVNVAKNNGWRPRWRISPEALEAFLKPRTARPEVKPERRRREPPLKRYYPEKPIPID